MLFDEGDCYTLFSNKMEMLLSHLAYELIMLYCI